MSVCNCYCSKCGNFGNGHCENCEVAMSAMQEREKLTIGYIGERLFFKIGNESLNCNCIGGDLPMRITDAFRATMDALAAEREAKARREALIEVLKVSERLLTKNYVGHDEAREVASEICQCIRALLQSPATDAVDDCPLRCKNLRRCK